ncbi:MAG TPA: methionyl-tRNA formyltransferase [Candidatus Saccharimonadales bacterium]|nr:methionyl-tRNA formyltransferase [Candidatus Saccharimonadales bacterium]
MKKTSKTIVFFGNERLATGVTTTAPVLKALIEAGYHVAAVVSHYEHGKSRNVRELEVQKVAEAHDIPVLLPDKPAHIVDQLKAYGAGAGVLVAYGKLVPQSVIDIFPHGIINLHPSLLPTHRGPTPIEGTILDGDNRTGVSIMQLVQKMDAGPVYGQSEIDLTGNETKQDLAAQLAEVGRAMMIELLPGILEGSIVAIPQDESRASYDALLSKADGSLDWNKPASRLEREIRAFQGWPQSRTEIAELPVIITKARLSDQKLAPGEWSVQDASLLVGCTTGSLIIEWLKPAGKAEMTAQAFLAGYGNRLGR